MEGVSQDWELEGQTACWDCRANDSKVADGGVLKLVTALSVEQVEARSGDSTSEEAAWSTDCRSWKVKEARREEEEEEGRRVLLKAMRWWSECGNSRAVSSETKQFLVKTKSREAVGESVQRRTSKEGVRERGTVNVYVEATKRARRSARSQGLQ